MHPIASGAPGLILKRAFLGIPSLLYIKLTLSQLFSRIGDNFICPLFGELDVFVELTDCFFCIGVQNVFLLAAVISLLAEAVKVGIFSFGKGRGYPRATFTAIESAFEVVRVFSFSLTGLVPDS